MILYQYSTVIMVHYADVRFSLNWSLWNVVILLLSAYYGFFCKVKFVVHSYRSNLRMVSFSEL